mgnify:CR=1 FL=1
MKTGNVYILFTKVASTPQNELTGPQTSVWHFGWNTPNSRQYDEKFRAMGLQIAQMWDALDGKLVDMSSDVLPGLPTQEQILEMRAKGTKPTLEGGFGYLRGPDGAMIENAQAGTAERFNHVHMYHEHPNCAMDWYAQHLGAQRPQGRGRGGRRRHRWRRRLRDAAVARLRRGRPSPRPDLFASRQAGDLRPRRQQARRPTMSRLRSVPGPAAALVSTRGKIVDHWAVSTADLSATVTR